jgi:hypothetical protein
MPMVIPLSGPTAADAVLGWGSIGRFTAAAAAGRAYLRQALPAGRAYLRQALLAGVKHAKDRVHFAGRELPAWLFMAAALGVLVLGIAATAMWRLMLRDAAEAPRATLAEPAEPQSRVTPEAALEVEIAVLRAKPPAALTVADVLQIAKVASEEDRRGGRLLRERLAHDPSAINDKATLWELRRLAGSPSAAQDVLAAIAELPQPTSADILYEIWTGTTASDHTIDIARALINTPEVRRKASDALAIALDLQIAETCESRRSLLKRALEVGDRRSVPLLSNLKRRTGCGSDGKRDCYACLRGRGQLDAAIRAAKRRPAPGPFGGL